MCLSTEHSVSVRTDVVADLAIVISPLAGSGSEDKVLLAAHWLSCAWQSCGCKGKRRCLITMTITPNNNNNRPGPWQGNKSGVYDTAYRAGQDDYYRGKDKHMTNHKKLYDSNTHDTFKRGYEAGYDAARRKGKR